jgi:hypothetical protein
MGFLEFLFYFFLIIFGLRIVGRIFGPTILRWTLRRVANRMQAQMQRQQEAYNRAYAQQRDPYQREEVNLRNGVHVKVPRADATATKQQRSQSTAEDVDFEEI